MKPLKGRKKDGAMGFVKGVGRGVLGLVAAPVSGEHKRTPQYTIGIYFFRSK